MKHYTENIYKLAAELSPDAVRTYLEANGWRCAATYPDLTIYSRGVAVEVPLNTALADYGRRMCEALDDMGGPFLGLLHAIDPERFPRERILALLGVTP